MNIGAPPAPERHIQLASYNYSKLTILYKRDSLPCLFIGTVFDGSFERKTRGSYRLLHLAKRFGPKRAFFSCKRGWYKTYQEVVQNISRGGTKHIKRWYKTYQEVVQNISRGGTKHIKRWYKTYQEVVQNISRGGTKHDMFCTTPFYNCRRPFWGRNVLLSEAVYVPRVLRSKEPSNTSILYS